MLITATVLFFGLGIATVAVGQTSPRVYRLGVFQGGENIDHAGLRAALRRQLREVAPEKMEILFAPEAYMSADWNRQTSRLMARQLTANPDIDAVITLGPWTVEDLLAAGFDRPIIALYRFDPVSEGLVDSSGRSRAANVTTVYDPGRIESDIRLALHLHPIKRLGVLCFPSDSSSEATLDVFRRLGERYGFQVVTAEGYNNRGTFAYFKAFQRLPKPVDAVYLTPLWGLTGDMMRQFYDDAARGKTPMITAGGRAAVERGALFAPRSEMAEAVARFAAYNIVRILLGDTPADLPTQLQLPVHPAINEGTAEQVKVSVPYDLYFISDVVTALPSQDLAPLRLTDAVTEAHVQNYGLQAIAQRLRAAAAAAAEVWAEYKPQLSVSGSYGYIDDNAVENSAGRFTNSRATAGIDLSQAILSLKTVKQAAVMRTRAALDSLDLRQAELDLELAVTSAYIQYVTASEKAQAAGEFRRRITRQAEAAHVDRVLKRDDGRGWLFWQQQWGQATADLVSAGVDKAIALGVLNTLLNRPADEPVLLDTADVSAAHLVRQVTVLRQLIPDPTALARAEELFAGAALAGAPTMLRVEREVDLQQANLSRNRAEFLPRIGLQASLAFVDSLAARSGFEEQHTTWSVGANFRLPLYLGGQLRAEKRRLDAGLNEAEYHRDYRRLQYLEQIHVWSLRLISRMYRLPLLSQAADQAEAYGRIIIEPVDEKLPDRFTLADTFANTYEARLRLIDAQAAFSEAATRLVHRVGWSLYDSGLPPANLLSAKLQTLSAGR